MAKNKIEMIKPDDPELLEKLIRFGLMLENENPRDLKHYINNIKSHTNLDIASDITVEHRSGNPKRDFLFVNQSQCKHIPNNPMFFESMVVDLAEVYMKETKNKLSDKVLVIAFAETATAIGAFFAKSINAPFYGQTTREKVPESKVAISFEEEHSHATTQRLLIDKDMNSIDDVLSEVDYVLFIDDEITTGKTILNFIDALKRTSSVANKLRFGVASICNWQNKENIKIFNENNIERFYLVTGNIKDVNIKMKDYIILNQNHKKYDRYVDSIFKFRSQNLFKQSRVLNTFGSTFYEPSYHTREIVDDIVKNQIPQITKSGKLRSIDVIGSEECMYPAYLVADQLCGYCKTIELTCHSSTRSKIDVIQTQIESISKADEDACGHVKSDIENWIDYTNKIMDRHKIASAYDKNRDTYIYNMNRKTDLTVIISDTKNVKQFHAFINDIASVLGNNAKRIVAYNI